ALAIAGDSLGGARAIFEQTIEYMKNREQFGRSIALFQALKHRAADLFAALSLNEQIVDHGVETASHRTFDAGFWAALAKAQSSETYVSISSDCVQLHGGVGYTWEFDVHLFLKRAR